MRICSKCGGWFTGGGAFDYVGLPVCFVCERRAYVAMFEDYKDDYDFRGRVLVAAEYEMIDTVDQGFV